MFKFLIVSTFITDAAGEDWIKDVDTRVKFGVDFGKARGFLKAGDPVVIVTGWKQGSGFTNTMRIMYVFEKDVLDK